jgi:Fe-S-cluster-containing dehydrogenase component
MKLNRRNFLKFSALTAMLGLTSKAEKAQARHNFTGWPERYGMLTDTTLCIGANCRKCEFACRKANRLPLDDLNLSDNSVFDRERRTDSKNYTVVNRFPDPNSPEIPFYVKKQCMHCDEPACASACLVAAFKKTPEGPVVYNKDVCIGCRYCMVACPFDIPAYDYFNAKDPQVRKCTMCYDRIKQGKIPACAEICPKEAITFGKRKDLISLAHEKIRNHPDRYHPQIFGEKEVGGTGWLYLAGADFAKLGFPSEVGITPYPELTRGFLGLVPIVFTIWPLLLTGLRKFSLARQKEEAKTIENFIGEKQ